jgi:hypothetical protein
VIPEVSIAVYVVDAVSAAEGVKLAVCDASS